MVPHVRTALIPSMLMLKPLPLAVVAATVLAFATACGGDNLVEPGDQPPVVTPPATITVLGRGDFKPQRTTAEVAVHGTTAYTTTWGNTVAAASVFYV